MSRRLRTIAVALFGLVIAACSAATPSEVILLRNPIKAREDLISQSGVTFDPTSSTDGNGSARIETSQPVTIRIAEIEPAPFDSSGLFYRARLRTQDLEGRAYLEMWCSFPGRGEFFSRALQDPVSGTTGWTTQQTSFVLQEGQIPDRIRLNLVIDGRGTVWIDDVVLSRAAHP